MQKFAEVNTENKTKKDRSNNQPARFTGSKNKSTNIHLVADDGEILETTQRKHTMVKYNRCIPRYT